MLSSKFGKKFGSGWTLSRSCSRSHWAAKRRAERLGARVGEHPPRLPSRAPGAVSLPLLASADQLLVGRRAPEEEREPRGEVEVGDAGRALRPPWPAARAPSGTRSAGWPAPPRAPRARRPRSRRPRRPSRRTASGCRLRRGQRTAIGVAGQARDDRARAGPLLGGRGRTAGEDASAGSASRRRRWRCRARR